MFIEHLEQTFAERCRKNPKYSLRAFARSLGIDSSTLSSILRRKRALTPKTARKLIEALDLNDPKLAQKLLLDVLGNPEKKEIYAHLQTDIAEVISSWEHFAILALLEIPSFSGNYREISKRLNISHGVTIDAMHRLEKVGLVLRKGASWQLTGKNMAAQSDIANPIRRKPLKQTIELALESLERDTVDSRDISGITMAIDKSKLPEAKKMIQEFRRNLAHFLEAGTRTSVYRLNLQLFPLSQGE